MGDAPLATTATLAAAGGSLARTPSRCWIPYPGTGQGRAVLTCAELVDAGVRVLPNPVAV
jgi:hypothetical protein